MGFYPDDLADSAASMQHPGAPAEKTSTPGQLKKKAKQNKTKIAD